MNTRRFLLALLVLGTSMSGTLHAMAAPVRSFDVAADVSDKAPRPKPTPGPRGDGDDN